MPNGMRKTNQNPLAIFGGTPTRQLPLPTGVRISTTARARVLEMMDSGLLSLYYSGPWARRFETEFAAFFGADIRGVSVNSGTSALSLALSAAGIGPGDEVIVPAFCFVAAASAIVQNNAIPVICDVEPQSLTMSATRARELISPRTKAVLVVHFWGYPADMDSISTLCSTEGLTLIEDCAQAFGATVRRRRVGTFGDYAAFAFSVRKHISCGEGGMVICADHSRYNTLRTLSNYGKGPDWDDYERLGFSCRMAEFPAIIGLDGLSRLTEEISDRQNAGRYYGRSFLSHGLLTIKEPEWGESVYFKCPVLVPDGARSIRDDLVKAISAENISCRIPHRPLFRIDWLTSYLRKNSAAMTADDCPVARDAHSRLFELETGPWLPMQEAEMSCEGTLKVWRHFAGTRD